jgi:cell division protein ZapA (FtsZ GTPase activity inhibitor)
MTFTPLTEEQEKLCSRLANLQRRTRALALNGLLARARVVVVNAILATAERQKAEGKAQGTKKQRFTRHRIRKLTKRKEAAQRRVQHCALIHRRMSVQLGMGRVRLAHLMGG